MLGEKIISERKKCKLSQEDLAEKLGITRQTISNWELNETSPDLKQASKLCDIFNISLDELTGKENAILTKLDKTESNSKLIIKLVKTVGITLGTLIFILLCIVTYLTIIITKSAFSSCSRLCCIIVMAVYHMMLVI